MPRINLLFVTIFILGIAKSYCQILDSTYNKNVYEKIHYSSRPAINSPVVCKLRGSNDTAISGIETKKLPWKIRKYFSDIQFINSGRRYIPSNDSYTPTKNDTSLLFYKHGKIFGENPFLLCNHEVTNKEYREFTNWVRDSIARTIIAKKDSRYYISNDNGNLLNWTIPINWKDTSLLELFLPEGERFYRRREIDTRKLNYKYTIDNSTIIINIYPDTAQWVKELSSEYFEPMKGMYYWHPAYDDYPVVGVSWEQAIAFCHWKTEQMKKLFATLNVPFKFPEFRLPSELEWEYAAMGSCTGHENYNNVFPWNDNKLLNENGKYYANSGIVIDQNNLVLKKLKDDELFTTSPIKHYKENGFGLYDMGGNVAEWVKDSISPVSLMNYFDSIDINSLLSTKTNINYEITENDNNYSVMRRIVEIHNLLTDHSKLDTLLPLNKERMLNNAANLLHDWKITHDKGDLKIAKGGSWADPPVYMIINMNQFWNKYSGSCRIGFRVAMSLTNEMLPFYYTEKYPIHIKVKKHSKKSRLYE